MNLNDIKLTPAQALILNGLLSLLGSAGIGAISAAYQYYTIHGLDFGILINIMLATFLALFAKALHDYVPSHARDLIQAGKDAATEAQTALQQFMDHATQLSQPVAVQPAPAGPLVVIHTTQAVAATPLPAVEPATPLPAVEPAATQPQAVEVAALPIDPLATPGMIPVVKPATTLQYVTEPTSTAGYPGDTWTRVQAANAGK